MKLCTFVIAGETRLGLVRDDRVLDLTATLPDAPRDMIGLITEWRRWAEPVGQVERGSTSGWPIADVVLLAPIPQPRKVLAIGLNYADHIAESGMETPQDQLWFCKQPTSVNGPFDPIEIPKVSDMIDYEAELVAVVGSRGRHIAKADAPAAIFGYMVGNDVSVRDWQRRTPQWMLGKSFDTHAPVGPWITTSDEVGDPHALDIRCLVNDEVRQDSNTRHLVFDVFAQVEHLSKVMTLEPGDLIFTGTPGGVGLAMDPPRYLAEGDRVRVEIARLGAIEGRFVREAA
jgi:2-keto-4-pentenoate hydratase/2-oxohepta-3-ene-1,7-dioic acid hydratase in catechol pathway